MVDSGSWLATVLVLGACLAGWYGAIHYIRSVLNGGTRPHTVSWLLWTILNGVNLYAQENAGAGIAVAVTASATAFSLIVFLLSLRLGSTDVRRSDWCCLGAAAVAIAIWPFTSAELSVAITVAINVFAFVPTLRKSSRSPESENITPYAIGAAEWLVLVITVAQPSFVSIVWGAVSALLNVAVVLTVLWCRRPTIAIAPVLDERASSDLLERHAA